MTKHLFMILAYRQSPYLEACIQSLLAQTVKSKIMLSTSTPSEWLTAIGSKYSIPICVRDGETNIADDWNFALSVAETELVTLAHQDDLYHSSYAERLILATQRYPDTLIYFTNNDLLIDDHIVAKTINLTIQRVLLWPFRVRNHIRSRLVRRMTLAFGNPICCPSVTYHKSFLRQMGRGFEFDRSFPNNLDWEAWIRLASQKGSYVYDREILITHRFHQDSETSASLTGQKRQQDDRRIFNLLWPKPVAAAIAGLYALAYRSKHG